MIMVFNPGNHIGITSVSYYIPENTLSSSKIASMTGIPEEVFHEKLGMYEKHIAAPDEHPTDMAVKSANSAIDAAGIDPGEIDLLVYCSAGIYDYGICAPSATVQYRIGAENAYGFEVRNACNAGNLALNIARGLMHGDDEMDTALVVCSDKLTVSIDYTNKKSFSVFHCGDGSASAIVTKGSKKSRILSYASMTDGSLSEELIMPAGGTKYLPGSEYDPCFNYVCVRDPERLNDIFDRIYLKNYTRVIKEAIMKSGHTTDDISFLFTNQVKQSLSEEIFCSVGVPQENTFRSMRNYGHMGPVDTFFCLAKTLEEGRITNGDIVVMASSAAGFTWGATVVEFL